MMDFFRGIFKWGDEVASGERKVFEGGKNFDEYKRWYWSKHPKPSYRIITDRTTGKTWKEYMELHHRFIPQRWQRKYNLPNWLVNNRLNLEPLWGLEHAARDPYRARFLPRWVKEMFNVGL